MKVLIYVLICAVVLISCKKDNAGLTLKDVKIDESGTIIKYGYACGWCAGIDSLTISSNDLWFISQKPCDNVTKVEHKSLTGEEKDDLFNSLNINEFSKIELNTCNICVDGCDHWISVKNDSFYHLIRYGFEDSITLSSIRIFIGKLDMLKAKFN
jgi:hypothetical protein